MPWVCNEHHYRKNKYIVSYDSNGIGWEGSAGITQYPQSANKWPKGVIYHCLDAFYSTVEITVVTTVVTRGCTTGDRGSTCDRGEPSVFSGVILTMVEAFSYATQTLTLREKNERENPLDETMSQSTVGLYRK